MALAKASLLLPLGDHIAVLWMLALEARNASPEATKSDISTTTKMDVCSNCRTTLFVKLRT